MMRVQLREVPEYLLDKFEDVLHLDFASRKDYNEDYLSDPGCG